MFAAGWASPPYRRQCQDTPRIYHIENQVVLGTINDGIVVNLGDGRALQNYFLVAGAG